MEISGVHGGCNDSGTSNCTLLAIYFIIFQQFASNTLSKRLHPRRWAEMGFCKWGLSIFKARSDSREARCGGIDGRVRRDNGHLQFTGNEILRYWRG